MSLSNDLVIIAHVVLIGGGATMIMDIWTLFLRRMGVPTLDFALIGRWVGHLFHGRFAHAAIRQAAPVAHERLLGWITHYAIGMVFAAMLVGIFGSGWMRHPALMPALLFGVGTVVAPLFVMQPAMGSGFASSKTPTPVQNCLRSVINHTVFGFGLYLSAAAIARVA